MPPIDEKDTSRTSREAVFSALTGDEKRLLYELERELWFEKINGREILSEGDNKPGRPK